MKFIADPIIKDIIYIQPRVFPDDRGYFFESYQAQRFADNGIDCTFVQDNQSSSTAGVLRGLHLQTAPKAQAKCISVAQGEIYDVAVDVRPDSDTFGKWVGYHLSSDRHDMLFIPEGFAHGFVVTSNTAKIHYKCSEFYDPATEKCLLWNDPDVGIKWPIKKPPILSTKDQQGLPLASFINT